MQGFYKLAFDRENDRQKLNIIHGKCWIHEPEIQISFIDGQEMNELGGNPVSLSTCYIPDTTEQITIIIIIIIIISGFNALY
jgi:hypothetical protein